MNDSTIETPVSFAVEQLKTSDVCKKKQVTFDKLPKAVGYLTEQVIKLKRIVSDFNHQHQTNTCWLRLRMSYHQKSQAYLFHAQNKRGVCLWTDELSAWFKNFNRYNYGSEE